MELTTLQAAVLFGGSAFIVGFAVGIQTVGTICRDYMAELLGFNEELIEDNKRLGLNIVQMGEASDRRVAELLAEGRFE